jgi:hypothetical protein
MRHRRGISEVLMLLDFNDCSFDGSQRSRGEHKRALSDTSALGAKIFPDLRDDVASDELEVVSLNLSRHGVGMELPHDVPVGSVMTIEIGTSGRSVQSQVRITSCDPIADGLFRAGGEFC